MTTLDEVREKMAEVLAGHIQGITDPSKTVDQLLSIEMPGWVVKMNCGVCDEWQSYPDCYCLNKDYFDTESKERPATLADHILGKAQN